MRPQQLLEPDTEMDSDSCPYRLGIAAGTRHMLAVDSATWWEVLVKERSSAGSDVTPSDVRLCMPRLLSSLNSLDTPILDLFSLYTKTFHHGGNHHRSSRRGTEARRSFAY